MATAAFVEPSADGPPHLSFSPEVQAAIDQVLESADPLDAPDFNATDYINQLFPTEQSLSAIDDVIGRMETQIGSIDQQIRTVVRGQSTAGQDGRSALAEAQSVIVQLFAEFTEIKQRAEHTEETVKEITRDIKQLDCAKKNLTSAITTLNHLHMLVGGVESLTRLAKKRQYGELLNPLQAITEVNQHFRQYARIDQIKELSSQVELIHRELAAQITQDFHQVFSGTTTTANPANPKMSLSQLGDACRVVSVLDVKVKRDLLNWFITIQLQEYGQLFQDSQDIAWLDKIDKRYAWLKRHLLDFEAKHGTIFPGDWEVSERIAVRFCQMTRDDLQRVLPKRRGEIDVKLLLFAIAKTVAFEQLLAKRFNGSTMRENEPGQADSGMQNKNKNRMRIVKGKEEEQKKRGEEQSQMDEGKEPVSCFVDLIGSAFKPFLDIYTESVDRNLADIIERFVLDAQTDTFDPVVANSQVFPSCADLFVFYKKCMVQCAQLSTGRPMLDLALVFKKYLREYATRLLEAKVPKVSTVQTSLGTSMSLLTKDLQHLSTAAGQVIHSLLKEGETVRYTREELVRLCCILATAEYCLDTVEQLEDKLRQRIDPPFGDQVDLGEEKDVFHRLISHCIQFLVQDLESGCEAALVVMSKIAWQNIGSVGDQSPFVNALISQFKLAVPIIRDNLSSSRKYYTQFCLKFVNAFIPKYINTLYKCRPTTTGGGGSSTGVGSSSGVTTTPSGTTGDSTLFGSVGSASSMTGGGQSMMDNIMGCEQLLLDTHSLKTVLLDLPSIGSMVQRKAPASYTKVVVKGMAKAEMIVKVVMVPAYPAGQFVDQFVKLLPESPLAEFVRVLEMKGLRRVDQAPLVELFKRRGGGTMATANVAAGDEGSPGDSPVSETGADTASATVVTGSNTSGGRHIRKLEYLLKKRMPN